MCPAGFKWFRNGSYRSILSETTVAANVTRRVGPNPERVGFVLATGGATMTFRPTVMGNAVIAGTFSPAAQPAPLMITGETFGLMISLAWDFGFPTLGNTYQVWELVTPKDFQ